MLNDTKKRTTPHFVGHPLARENVVPLFLVPFSTALAVMYGARENGTTTGVVTRSIFSGRSLAPKNDTIVPYTLRVLDTLANYNGNGPVYVTTDTHVMIKVLHPKTAEEVVAREKERKAGTTLLMTLPKDHLAKFHKMTDAKEMWEAIKLRFCGNDESKKMHKYLLKQQFEVFFVSTSDGLHKGSLPSSWSQVALIMRTKPGLDTFSFDDLYNNLRVFEHDVKGTTASSSNKHNVSFVSTDNTSSTNDVSTAYSVSSFSVSKSQKEGSASYTDEVAMISMRIKKFYKRTGRKLQFDTKDPVGFNKTKVECFNCHEMRHFARDCRAKGNQDSRRKDVGYNGNKARDNGRRAAYQDALKALVTIDGKNIDWSGHVEDDTQNYAMMAYSSSNSGSDNEIRFMKIELDDKTDVLAYHKKLLAEALKEKEDLKTKFENWQNSSKNLSRLLNIQISANDKFGLGYRDYRYGSILSYENEVLQSVFMNKECDLEDTHVNDRYAERMHAVPSPMTGNYMPSGPDVEIDYSKFTYGSKQTSVDESDSKPSESVSCESDSSVETPTSMLEPIDNAPKVVCKPKVWTDTPIIEEYESDSDDDSVSNVQENKEKPSFAFLESVKHVKTSRENVKKTGTPNHCLKIEKQDKNGHTRKGLGYDFTRKACFVCGSFSHLIRDCDFHDKKMAKQAALTKSKNKVTGQRENTTVWNNVQRDDPHKALKDKGIIDSGCSRHMTGNKAHLTDYQEFKGGSVAFGGSNGRITGKGKIKAGRLDFEDVYYVEELKHYNLFSVSQMCDKKNKVLFTDTDCLVLSPNFKLPDENQVLPKIPRQHNMYSFNLKNIDPFGDLACLFLNSSIDESNKWNRRLGIKREYSNARTPQQNGVAERKNRTLIEAVITMLADSFLPTTFWAEAVITACKFDGKSNLGFLVEYSLNSKAFRVYNLETKRVEENLHVIFLKNKPTVVGKGHAWMFDLDYLTNSMNYEPVSVENQANKSTDPKEANNSEDKIDKTTDFKTCAKPVSQVEQIFLEELEKLKRQEKKANDGAESLGKEATHDTQNANTNSINLLNAVSAPVSVVGLSRAFNDGEPLYPDDPSMPHLEDIYASPNKGVFPNVFYDDEDVQIKSKVKKNTEAHALFQIQKVWIFIDLPFGKKAIRSKWVYRNKKDERGVVYRNKARLVAQGHRQEEGIDYDEVFSHVARIEAIRIFLAFDSYMGFIVYQMDVKNAFLYGTIDEEVYVTQPPGFVDPKFPNEVKQKEDGIFISQDKYVAEILKKFDFLSVRTASTPIENQKPLVKDEEAADVDVTPKTSHLQAMKRIFRYLKGQPKLGNPQQEVVNFLAGDSFYGNAKSKLLWLLLLQRHNMLLLLTANPVFHSKTKYTGTRHHFIRDAYEKKLIQVLKIHNDDKVVDLLTKAFDVSRSKRLLVKTSQIRLWLTICQKLFGIQLTMLHGKELASPKQTALDDADGVECLPNEEIFTELAPQIGRRRTNLVVQWRLLSSALLQVENSTSLMDDLSSHTTKYTSPELTQKVFANMRKIGKGFSRVETPLFATMLVQRQVAAEEEEDEEDETCTTLSQKVTQLEQDKIAQVFWFKKVKKGRKDDDNAAIKDASAAEPTMFDDEEVTMTMAQTLIMMKAERERLLDEKMAKRLHDEEVEQAAAKEKQEIDDMEKAKVKYRSLKRKPISIAQARKNMIIYLKNMAGYKMEHFKGMIYEKVRPIFEREYNKVQTLFKPDKDVEEPTTKRVAEETLLQESFKKLKAVEVLGSHSTQDTSTHDSKEISEEDVKNMLEIILVSEFKVEALQVKYPLIDWEIHSEGSRLVKEKFSSAVPTEDKEKDLWVELKRFYEPNADDVLWKLQRYMHYPITWKLYSNCGVHQVTATTRRHDMFMLTEKNYPLSNGVMTLMLSAKLQLEEDSDMARDLVMKIFMEANKPKSKRINAIGLSLTAAGSRLMLLSKADTAAEKTEGITLRLKYQYHNDGTPEVREAAFLILAAITNVYLYFLIIVVE
nr:putative ribonuclease H-like domain-containing protein [Tanacetum cinerariifolium]